MLRFTRKGVMLLAVLMVFGSCQAISDEAKAKGFVDLHDIDPTIIISPRYATNENFLGKVVRGYKKPIVLMTKETAEALKKVQEAVKKDGYSLVVYDAYRPKDAVTNFVEWAEDVPDQCKKGYYYPRVNKADVFELGYVSKRSGHSRGSTVDLTLIKSGDTLHEVKEQERTLLDGFKITYLDDGTVDMGSSFDLFDKASHFENDLICAECKGRRAYLQKIMMEHNFSPYAEEWWHFTLKNERYPKSEDSSYHNFSIE